MYWSMWPVWICSNRRKSSEHTHCTLTGISINSIIFFTIIKKTHILGWSFRYILDPIRIFYYNTGALNSFFFFFFMILFIYMAIFCIFFLLILLRYLFFLNLSAFRQVEHQEQGVCDMEWDIHVTSVNNMQQQKKIL